MPRIDNTNPKVIKMFKLEFDKKDPGKTQPVDLCWSCFVADGFVTGELDVDHPPYEDEDGHWRRRCKVCNEPLSEVDN